MQFKMTKHQVARGALPDARERGDFLLIKRCKMLRATYQIKMLALLASERKIRLKIEIPRTCIVHKTLRALVREYKKTIKIVYVD